MDSKNKDKNNLFDSIDSKLGKIYLSALLVVLFLTSGILSYKLIDGLIPEKRKEPKNSDKRFEVVVSDSIYMKNQESYENEYYFKDNFLYDSANKKVNLISFSSPIYIEGYKIDAQTLANMNLGISSIRKLTLDFSTVTDDCVSYFPEGLKVLSLDCCDYITDLSSLPYYCPDLTKLSINGLSALKNLDFIYELKNLTQLDVSDSILLTEDLLKYLEDNGIKTNITKADVKIAEEINSIYNKIINSDMDETQKIKEICKYVVKNYGYDLDLAIDSNYNPLRCMFENKKGVCTGYAYLTNVLLNKAGIKSFVIKNKDHAWNLVEVGGIYYYVDVTNMDGNFLRMFLLNSLDFEKYYMKGLDGNADYMITSPKDERTLIPSSIVKDIETKNKDVIFSTYETSVYEEGTDIVSGVLGGTSIAITPVFGICAFKNIKDAAEAITRKKKKSQ